MSSTGLDHCSSFEPRSTEQIEGIIMAAMKSATGEPRTEYALAIAGRRDMWLRTLDRLGLGFDS
jgi:hypothetical protein